MLDWLHIIQAVVPALSNENSEGRGVVYFSDIDKKTVHNGPSDRVKGKKMLIVIYFSMVLMDFFHLYLDILNVNK